MLLEWTQELLSEEIIESVLAGLRDIAVNAEKEIHS